MITFRFLLFILIATFSAISCQKDHNDILDYEYFWGNDEKIYISTDYSSYLIKYSEGADLPDLISFLHTEFNVDTIEDFNNLLIAKGGFIRDLGMSFENYPDIEYMIPVYYLNDSRIVVINRIIIKLKCDVDINKVIEFTQNQVTAIKATNFDPDDRRYLLYPYDSKLLFDIANNIHENSGLVQYSIPDHFIEP